MSFQIILCWIVFSVFQAEAIKSINWWEITKTKYVHIDTDVCFQISQEEAEVVTEIEVKPPDTPKNPENPENPTSGWIITKEKIPDYCKDHNCMLSDLTEMPRAQLGKFVVQVEMFELTEKLKKKAELELRETPENMEESIPELQRLLKEIEGLKVPVDNVAWLKRFLRPTKYNPKDALTKVKSYYSFKIKNKKHIELYKGLKPSREKNLFDQDIMIVLPKRDQEGRRVLVVEIGEKWDYSKCSLDEIFKGAVIFLEAAMLEPETQISGAVIIFDMKGLSTSQIVQFTMNLPFVQRIVDLLQTAAPLRIKGMHIVNQPFFFRCLLSIFTNLMDDKFAKRIYQHGNMGNPKNQAKLHAYILPDRLPREYGGTCEIPRIKGPDWYAALSILDKEYEVVSSYGFKNGIK